MKTIASLAAVAATVAAISAAGSASAQDVAFNVAATSDYVFRGFSQTSEEPALQAGIDLTSGSLYAGGWVSNVDFGDSTEAEVDIYGGYRTEIDGVAFDFGAIVYAYTDSPVGSEYTYLEFKGAWSRAVGPVTAGGVVYFSPDYFGADNEATYVEGNLAFSPASKVTVSGAVGKQFLDVSDSYVTWNAGVAFAVTDNIVLDARYYDTDLNNLDIANQRVVGTVKLLF